MQDKERQKQKFQIDNRNLQKIRLRIVLIKLEKFYLSLC